MHTDPAPSVSARGRRLRGLAAGLSVVAGTLALWSSAPSAQQPRVHLNPVIAKLAEGRTVYGLQTADLSLAYAKEVARLPVDFIYADLEHNPLDFPALATFLSA